MRSARLAFVILISVAEGLDGAVVAQPAPLRLPPADATAPEEFTEVVALRELRDGRTLVIDGRERRLVVVDWATGRASPIGRQGDGPGEYRYPWQLIALGGDSSLLVDGQNGRWLVLRAAVIATTLERNRTRPLMGGPLSGADNTGRLLGIRRFASRPPTGVPADWGSMPGYADSVAVIMGSLTSSRVDTVAHLAAGTGGNRMVTRRVNGTPWTYVLSNPLNTDEQALLFSDGFMALAHASPYRVTWVAPGGQRISGATIARGVMAVTEDEKRAAIARRWFLPTYTGPRWTPDDFPAWPRTLPPFPRDALLGAPDGRLLVLCTPSAANAGTHYDIVDRRGELSAQLALRTNERIVGFGRNAVYIVGRDADDIERLRRHPWP